MLCYVMLCYVMLCYVCVYIFSYTHLHTHIFIVYYPGFSRGKCFATISQQPVRAFVEPRLLDVCQISSLRTKGKTSVVHMKLTALEAAHPFPLTCSRPRKKPHFAKWTTKRCCVCKIVAATVTPGAGEYCCRFVTWPSLERVWYWLCFWAFVFFPFQKPEMGFWANWMFNFVAHPVANYIVARGVVGWFARQILWDLEARPSLCKAQRPGITRQVERSVHLAPIADSLWCASEHVFFSFMNVYPIPFSAPLSCIPATFVSMGVFYLLLPKRCELSRARRTLWSSHSPFGLATAFSMLGCFSIQPFSARWRWECN